jgi:hypothetical protein
LSFVDGIQCCIKGSASWDQFYSFNRDVVDPIYSGTGEQFGPAAEEVFDRIMRMTDNAGATDEHRALNFLVVRYPAIYAEMAEEFARDFSLTGLEVRPSPLSGTRLHEQILPCRGGEERL